MKLEAPAKRNQLDRLIFQLASLGWGFRRAEAVTGSTLVDQFLCEQPPSRFEDRFEDKELTKLIILRRKRKVRRRGNRRTEERIIDRRLSSDALILSFVRIRIQGSPSMVVKFPSPLVGLSRNPSQGNYFRIYRSSSSDSLFSISFAAC